MAKRITAAILAGVAALGLVSCGDDDSIRDASSVAQEDASADSKEESSQKEYVITTVKESEPDDDDGSSVTDNIDTAEAGSIEYFETYDNDVFGADGETAMDHIEQTLFENPGGVQAVDSDDGFLNALGKHYIKRNINFDDGIYLLGSRYYNVAIDFDSDNGDVYTVAFRKNTDLNTDTGNTPDPAECKESYDELYSLFSERYGEPQKIYTPENDNFFGALWTDTPCGEIWLAWAEKIFGSQQPDCIVSFSCRGINTSGKSE